MKKTVTLVFVLLLAAGAFSLTLQAEKNSYRKGEAVQLSGTCDPGEVHRLRGELNNRGVFEEQANCFDGKFEFKYQTSFLDPSGNWTITLFTGTSETKIIVQIEPVPESAYYRITFLSPAVFTFQRGEPAFISVEITDSGEPVTDATAVMFDVFGRRIELKNEGNGIYDLNYSLPFNSPLGEWDLIVTALRDSEAEKFGGERKISTTIEQARFGFEIIEPKNRTFEQSDPIPFKVRASYANGKRLTADLIEKAELRAGNSIYPMEVNSEGELVLSYAAPQAGNLTHTIYVRDTAGNESEESVELTITCSITCLLKTYGLIALAVLLITGVVAKLFYSKTKKSFDLLALQKEREKNLELIKNLQKEYFEKAIMPASSYKKNLAEYKSRIIDLDEKIKQLKRKMEEEK